MINEELLGTIPTDIENLKNKIDNLNNNITAYMPSEWGNIHATDMNKETETRYIAVTFKKTYKNLPAVLVGNMTATSSRGYFGNVSAWVRDLSTTGFTLVLGYQGADSSCYVPYIVFSND